MLLLSSRTKQHFTDHGNGHIFSNSKIVVFDRLQPELESVYLSY